MNDGSNIDAQNQGATEYSEDQKIIQAIKSIFAAAATEDVAMFNSIVASEFYLFEGGVRYDGDAMMDLIVAIHASGKRYEWNVTDPDLHVSGDMAWIAYTNRGSITDGAGTTNQTWLESAVLRRRSGSWRVVFLHSTRTPVSHATA